LIAVEINNILLSSLIFPFLFGFLNKYGSRRTPGRFKVCSRPPKFFLKTDLKSGGQDGAFGTKQSFLAQKLKKLAFLCSFLFMFFNNKDSGLAIRDSSIFANLVLTDPMKSKNFSESSSEFVAVSCKYKG
jgi:hypothetical protein